MSTAERPPAPKGRMRRAERDALRSQETRTRLLEAALEVLVEKGYAGFSTVAVCERANSPRGTLLHHFPSREALVVASLEHVFDRRVDAFQDAWREHTRNAAAAGRDKRAPRELLDFLWSEMKGPANVAWLELVVASRTHPDLRAQLGEVVRRFDGRVRESFTAIAPPRPGEEPLQELLVRVVFATLNGLSIDRAYRDDVDAEPVLAALSAFAEYVARARA